MAKNHQIGEYENINLADCIIEFVNKSRFGDVKLMDPYKRSIAQDYLNKNQGLYNEVFRYVLSPGSMMEPERIRQLRESQGLEGKEPGEGSKRQTPRDSGLDWDTAEIQAPTSTREQAREAFHRFARDNPEEAAKLAYEFVREAEGALPPEQRHSLGLREAARRISEARGINLDHSQLRNYFKDSKLKIGIEGPRREPLFSPAECDAFIPPPPKKRGPRKGKTGEGA